MKQEKRGNMCGKKIVEKREECLEVQKEWGYFSEDDRKGYRFCICEKCFKEFVTHFAISAKIYEQTELI